MYKLTLAYEREQADLIAPKVKKAFDALFVEYSTMRGGSILKSTPSAQSFLEVEVKKNYRKGCLEGMMELNTHFPSRTLPKLDQYLTT